LSTTSPSTPADQSTERPAPETPTSPMQAAESVASVDGDPVIGPTAAAPIKLGLMDRIEASIARLSTRSNFWHRLCSMIWLPYAFRSGIRMKRLDNSTFAAELPFRRFNRNWYNAMAGAALLGNAEIAGGMYIFGVCGSAYTIVCKELTYKFLRPCFGPALYKITSVENLDALIATGNEFNCTVEMDVIQQAVLPKSVGKMGKDGKRSLVAKLASKDRRVGRVVATFHITPHVHQKAKRGGIRQVG